MILGIVAMVWNRPTEHIERWAAHLKTHPDCPRTILIDQSEHNLNFDNGVVCRRYGINHFYTPRETMNMSLAFNLGLKLVNVDIEYVMFTGIDWLFSSNFFTVLQAKVGERKFISAMGGYLPEGYDLTQEWSTLTQIAEQGEISRRLSPGVCQCVPWRWAYEVHGYDERFPAQDGVDDDFRCRAIKAGLESVWIEWTEAQALHVWHERSPLKGVGSELFGDSPVIANPDGLGQYP